MQFPSQAHQRPNPLHPPTKQRRNPPASVPSRALASPRGGGPWETPARLFGGRCSPPVGDAAAVAAHAQALLQVGGEAGGGDAAAAVGAHALLVLPLVVDLPKDVHARLVHDLCGRHTRQPPRDLPLLHRPVPPSSAALLWGGPSGRWSLPRPSAWLQGPEASSSAARGVSPTPCPPPAVLPLGRALRLGVTFPGFSSPQGLQNGSSGPGRSHSGSTGTAGGTHGPPCASPSLAPLVPKPLRLGPADSPRSLFIAFPDGPGSGMRAVSPSAASPRPRGAAECSPKSFMLSGSVSSRKK